MSKDILDRIKKLMRLTEERGATPAEAAAASAKVAALLFEHNMTISDIGDIKGGEKAETIGKEGLDLNATYITSHWHASLVNGISKPLFTRCIYHTGKGSSKAGRMSLIGKPSNVEVVRYMYNHLSGAIESMAKDFQKQWKADQLAKFGVVSPNDSAKAKINFCFGVVDTVNVRIKEMYVVKAAETNTSTAMVVVSDQQLDMAYKKAFPHTEGVNISRRGDYDSRAAGREAGHSISLSRGITGNYQRKIT